MFSIQAQKKKKEKKKIASYKENNQEQRADDSFSDLIICDHPLSKITKTKKNKNEDQQGVSRLWVYFKWRWIKQGATQVWANLKQKRKNNAKLNTFQKNQHNPT